MSTKDFIALDSHDKPRHDQNMPEGIEVPVPKGWHSDRPGDLNKSQTRSSNLLRGNAGPNVGYAIKLVRLSMKDFFLLNVENEHDVEMLLAEIAMRRASFFGRAPLKSDVEFASRLLSFNVEPAQGEENWRPIFVHGCAHEEHKRRKIVNSIPEQIVSGHLELNQETINGWWEVIADLF